MTEEMDNISISRDPILAVENARIDLEFALTQELALKSVYSLNQLRHFKLALSHLEKAEQGAAS